MSRALRGLRTIWLLFLSDSADEVGASVRPEGEVAVSIAYMSRNVVFGLRALVLALVALLMACSQVDPSNPYDPGAPESVQARGTISGVAVLASGEPAREAEVALAGTALTGTTDAEGRFRLTDVPKGVHALTVRFACYRTLTVPGLSVDLGSNIDVGTLSLEGSVGACRVTRRHRRWTPWCVRAGHRRTRPPRAHLPCKGCPPAQGARSRPA
jgi:hypothetical protein